MRDVAQWQSWLRHSREEVPSIEELLEDEERQRQIKVLAKIADGRWGKQKSVENGQQQSMGKLPFGNTEEALKAIRGDEEQKDQDQDPGEMKRNLPGQDPGSTFQPQKWSGKVGERQRP